MSRTHGRLGVDVTRIFDQRLHRPAGARRNPGLGSARALVPIFCSFSPLAACNWSLSESRVTVRVRVRGSGTDTASRRHGVHSAEAKPRRRGKESRKTMILAQSRCNTPVRHHTDSPRLADFNRPAVKLQYIANARKLLYGHNNNNEQDNFR